MWPCCVAGGIASSLEYDLRGVEVMMMDLIARLLRLLTKVLATNQVQQQTTAIDNITLVDCRMIVMQVDYSIVDVYILH